MEADGSNLEGGQAAKDIFEILVREHADMLTAYLRTLLGRDSAVDDLFQETMIVAWRRLKDYDKSRPLAPWLRGIARRLVLEHARKSRRLPTTTDPQILAAIDRRFEILGASSGDTFVEKAERLLGCLELLPTMMRRVIDLVYGRNMALEAVAVHVGASKEAVMKRVQRGRQLLAECMKIGENCG